MSIIGGKYKYDLFVSYSHGVALQDPTAYDQSAAVREWSRRLVKDVTNRLRIGFADDGMFEYYLDAREAESAQDLDKEVEEAIRKSAVLLVLMSPGYRDSKWCRNELQWFFEQADADGRGALEQCVLRVIIPTKHAPEAGKSWPTQLVGQDGNVVNRGEPFHDNDNVPIELNAPTFVRLEQPILSLVSELRRRLMRLKEQLQVADTMQAATAASKKDKQARKPQLYLQRSSDAEAWQKLKVDLSDVALTTPTQMEPEPDLSLLKSYVARRLDALKYCHGLVLMRCATGEPSQPQLAAGYSDRQTLYSIGDLNVPWVLVDKVGGDAPPIPPEYELPRVLVDGEGWKQQVLDALGLR